MIGLGQTLYRYGSTVVSRRVDAAVGSVIVKSVSRLDAPACAALRSEYQVLATLPCPQIPKALDLVTEAETLDLWLEDIDGTSLDQLKQPLEVETLIHVVLHVSMALTITHRARCIHRDVNPRNFIYNSKTKRVQLIDFGLAGLAVAEQPGGRQAGTFAYFSPEQTGRTQRPVDHRSDLYALGVTLYQLIAGRLPFDSADKGELFQQILSASPAALPRSLLQKSVPPPLAQIVMRLMRKDPTERYQSAAGLTADLSQLLDRLARGQGLDFALGLHDRLEALVLQDRLYGTTEQAQCLTAFYQNAVRGGSPRLALVHGEPGVGKSSLVASLQGAVRAANGMWLSGKHSAQHQDSPFDSIRQIISQLTRQILSLPESEVATWRRRLQNGLGRAAGALAEVAPELRHLLGPTEPVAPMESQQAENRLLELLRRFVEVLGRQAPLLIFIDDLQWADAGSLKFLAALAAPGLAEVPVAFIGTYRDSEVGPTHRLSRCLDDLVAKDVAVLQMHVTALSTHDLTALLQDLFTGSSTLAVQQLADFICGRTQNNPFYVRELLAHCWRRRLIDFDAQRGGFVWDAEHLAQAPMPEGAVGLVISQINALPTVAADLLSLAACLGNTVSDSVLQAVTSTPLEDSLRALLQAGLLLVTDVAQTYRFAHDRVRQAAYERLAADKAQEHHYRLANALRPLYAQGSITLFELLDQVNAALPLLDSEAQRQEAATWNQLAAEKARQALAYDTAQRCLETALRLLPSDLAQRDLATYDTLHIELAINVFMRGEAEAALDILAALLPLSSEGMRVARIHAQRILILGARGRKVEALQARDAGLHALGYDRVLGSKSAAPLRLLTLAWKTRRLDATRIRTFPRCSNARAELAQRLLALAGVWAHEVGPSEALANTVWATRLTLQEGWTGYSPPSIGGFALILALLHRSKAAARIGAAARALYQMAETPNWFSVELVVLNWSDSLRAKPSDLVLGSERCYEGARQVGDPVWSGLCVASILGYTLYISLDRTLEVCESTAPLIKSLRNPMQMGMFMAWQQLCHCLMGRSEGIASLASPGFDRETVQAYLTGAHGLSAVVSMAISQVMSFVVNGAYNEAKAAVPTLLATQFWRSAALPSVSAGLFYSAVALTKATAADLPQAKKLHKQLTTIARSSDGHLAHGDVLALQGLFEEARGNYLGALPLLNRAIEASRFLGYLDRECVVVEYTGRVHARLGNIALASLFLRQAQSLYTRWGAQVRAQHLARELELHHEPARVSKTASSYTSATSRESDAAALLEGLQVLCRALPTRELATQTALAVQKAMGATRAALLQQTAPGWQPIADTSAGDRPALHAALQLAANTRRVVTLADLPESSRSGQGPKSLACVPMEFGGRLIGLLYLENDHVDGAFAAHRYSMLETWSAQAAAALAHAAVRSDLQAAVQRVTHEESLAHQQRLAVQRESTEGQMAGGFAHEMRNALGGAGFALQALYDQPNPDAIMSRLRELTREKTVLTQAEVDAVNGELTIALELLATINDGMDRARRITDQILEYSQAGQWLASDAPTQLAAVVQTVLDEQAERLSQRAIELRVQVDSVLHVGAQESHATTIVRHLVRNAIDALYLQDSADRHLILECEQHDERIQLQVRDTAAGMEPAVQAKVFEPFFSTRGAAGVGLGLGLSRKLARLHGGELTFVSEPGRGTTFSLTLPASRPKSA